MSPDQLAALGKNAMVWAKAYVTLKDALLKQGVTQDEAREEARYAANMAAFWDTETGEPCPLCGQPAGE